MTVPPGWFTRHRYGGPAAILGSVAVFGLILCAAGYTIISSASLASDACYGEAGQLTCPATGPAWARPVPGVAAFLGLLSGFGGLVAGRPARTPALAAGAVLVTVGLLAGWALVPG